MRIRAIDRDGDWQWGLGRQDYRADFGALEQDIRTKIRSWLNDCFFAMDEGIEFILSFC
ncbi:hypothetical protein FACS1894152_5600 [Bacilli bacterium]|nr:hypothetical protein FACS1894152_5600 [Bacilli bacterium]